MLRVCVAGQSVAGLASAALLSRMAIVKQVTMIAPKVSSQTDDRFSTGLWSAALAVLQQIGVNIADRSGCVEDSGFRSRDGVALCKPSTSMHRFTGDAGTPSLHFVRNNVLLEALGRAAERGGKLREVQEHVVWMKRTDASGGPVTVVCGNGDEYECDLLIAADGMLSSLRQQLCSPHEGFLKHRGYRVYSGHTSERLAESSFQSWGDGKRFACVPTDTGNQWFATLPSLDYNPYLKGLEGPLSNNSQTLSQQEWQQLMREFSSCWHAEVGKLISASATTGAARSCEALAFSSVPFRGSALFAHSDVVFMGDAGFTLDPILAQGAGLAVEEAAVYSRSLLRAAEGSALGGGSGADKKTLLDRAAESYRDSVEDRRRRLFWLSHASQLVGSLSGSAAVARDALLRSTPAAVKGRAFDFLIGVSNGTG